jgi:hypothetical protein
MEQRRPDEPEAHEPREASLPSAVPTEPQEAAGAPTALPLEPKKDNVPTVGEPRRGSLGLPLLGAGVGVARPAFAAGADVNRETLLVYAMASPALLPPRVAIQQLGEDRILVFSWLAPDPPRDLPEVKDTTYTWPLHGPPPSRLIVRKVPNEKHMDSPLTEAAGPEVPARELGTVETSEGPSVSLDPGYIPFGVAAFFQHYQCPQPSGLKDPVMLAGIRPTASGRHARALGSTRLAHGGLRARIAIPIDPGEMAWGPRDSKVVDFFVFGKCKANCEWLIELE